jgi:4-amino-4-deoxy-L-arabinose transferase-like glycosyltransferase
MTTVNDAIGTTPSTSIQHASIKPSLRVGAIVLAVVFTLLNAVKPLHIDDSYYYIHARHIAEAPFDPYGFSFMFINQWLPANNALAPPLLLYWWAAAIRLFGTQPLLWKLWLLPFSLAFSLSLAALFERFASGLVRPLLCMTVLSPTFLPSLNLMVDVPALALSLLGLVVFMRAVDRDSWTLAMLAGFAVGLAMQTKYTAILAPPVALAYALLWKRPRLWVGFALPAGAVFVLWEAFVAFRYGESHFLHHLRAAPNAQDTRLGLVIALFTVTGGLAPAIGLLGLVALRWRGWLVGGAACAAALVYLCLTVGICDFDRELLAAPGIGTLRVIDLLFGLMGVGVFVACLAVARSLLSSPGSAAGLDRALAFLLCWLAIEIIGSVAISPFPAARRVMGIVVVLSLLVGRLASRTCAAGEARRRLNQIAAGGVALGLLFYAADWREAFAEKQAVAAALKRIGPLPAGATVWHTASWGFQYYAEDAGIKLLIPEHTSDGSTPPTPTRLHAGDWLLLVDVHIPQEWVHPPEDAARVVDSVEISDGLTLDALHFYSGRAPLEHRDRNKPRVRVTLVRVIADAYCAPP